MIDQKFVEEKEKEIDKLWQQYHNASEELSQYIDKNTDLPNNIFYKAKDGKSFYKLVKVNGAGSNYCSYKAHYLSINSKEIEFLKEAYTDNEVLEQDYVPCIKEEWNKALETGVKKLLKYQNN